MEEMDVFYSRMKCQPWTSGRGGSQADLRFPSSCILIPEAVMKRIFLLLIMLLILLGCATFATTPTPTPPLIPTGETPSSLPEPTDPTQLILVAPGSTFDIILSSNPSTGYRWQLVRELDPNLLRLEGQTYIAGQPVLAGSGGVDVWTFSALTPGDTTIELGYYPPSDDTQPEETVTYSVRVE